MSADIRPGLTGGYDRRDFGEGPSVYSDQSFLEKIISATGLNEEIRTNIGDFMSGSGSIGLAIRDRFPYNRYFFLDSATLQLHKVAGENNISRVAADVREMPIGPESMGTVVVRYGIKDIPEGQQLGVLDQIHRVLKPGGVFVLADMFAPNRRVKDWLNRQHSLKQILSGRNPHAEGTCHIHTQDEWVDMIRYVGFEAKIFDYHVSKVDTASWVRGNQVNRDQLARLNHMILVAPEEAIAAFEIKSESHPGLVGKNGLTREQVANLGESLRVGIEYPTVIISAIKPQTING